MVDGAAIQGPEPRVVLVLLLAFVSVVVVLVVVVVVIAAPRSPEVTVVVDGLFKDIPLSQILFRVRCIVRRRAKNRAELKGQLIVVAAAVERLEVEDGL
jgi:hypothetical protein